MEIERKFLLERLPDLEKEKTNIICTIIMQSYISFDPEIRIREVIERKKNYRVCSYYITEKSNGNLVREENEREISYKEYFMFYRHKLKEPIKKIYTRYILNNDLILEASIVNISNSESFIYGEIEFKTKEDAKNYIPEFPYIKEITYDDDYKMKNIARKKNK